MSYLNPGDEVAIKGIVGSVVNGIAYIRSINGADDFVISFPDRETSAVEVTRATRVFEPGDIAYFGDSERIRQRATSDEWVPLNFESIGGIYTDEVLNVMINKFIDRENTVKVFRNGKQIY